MKILLLNPHIDAEHKLLKFLQANHALLLPETAAEAWQMAKLHGQSLDLAIIHREADARSVNDADVGLKLVDQLKKDPSQADLPIILSSDKWTDAQFIKHQESPSGVNAYLRWPYSEHQLNETLVAMFGDAAAAKENSPAPPAHQGGLADQNDVALEEASKIYASHGTGSSSISLEAPWSDDPAPPEPVATLEPDSPLPEASQGSEGEIDISQVLELASGAELELSAGPRDVDLGESPVVADVPVEPGTLELQELPPGFPIDASVVESEVVEAPAPNASRVASMMLQPMPFGDAIVPGGAANSPDIETLKKYLLLREQDVATLSAQLRSAKQQLATMSTEIEEERAKNAELVSAADGHQRAVEDARKAGEAERQALRKEIEDLRFEIKVKMDKARALESQVREATQEMDRLKERVRTDIRKIRVREKELENRLEIARSDSEVLVSTREAKIVELKRKLDLLEFNMDLLQDRYTRERENSMKLRERLVKAAQVVRVVGGVLDSPGEPDLDAPPATAKDEGKQEAS